MSTAVLSLGLVGRSPVPVDRRGKWTHVGGRVAARKEYER
jgi:hypothetical protein